MNGVTTIATKELRDALRSRWLFAFAVTFAAVALLLSRVQADAGDVSAQGFNRTTAGLINLCLLLVPMLSLILGASAIAGERERGTMATLLAQPISPAELLVGKYVGLTVAVWGAIAMGFGSAGLLVALFAPLTDVEHYLLFVVLSAALASATLSIGMLVSVLADSRVKALGGAMLLWFVLVLLYDLGAIGLALALSSSGRTLLAVSLANPVESVRLLAVMSLERDLDVLGPLGAYLTERVGTGTSTLLLVGGVVIWTVAPLAVAVRRFGRQDA
ncbi:MAG: ABC transporter permease subunit [Dehalococcoidia bacterium]|nr:ABC transporter permease subunit [Dehalococcoidia bacterium]